jgi:hypothetical protein
MKTNYLAVAVLAFTFSLGAQQAPSPQSVLEHTKKATVVILAGEGAGRLQSISTGVILSKMESC